MLEMLIDSGDLTTVAQRAKAPRQRRQLKRADIQGGCRFFLGAFFDLISGRSATVPRGGGYPRFWSKGCSPLLFGREYHEKADNVRSSIDGGVVERGE